MTETPTPYITLEQLPPTLCKFLSFTKSHDQDAALQTYIQKYKKQPANIIRSKGNLYLGPVPAQQEKEE